MRRGETQQNLHIPSHFINNFRWLSITNCLPMPLALLHCPLSDWTTEQDGRSMEEYDDDGEENDDDCNDDVHLHRLNNLISDKHYDVDVYYECCS